MNLQPNATQEVEGKARCDEEDLLFNKYFKNLHCFIVVQKFYCKWFYIFLLVGHAQGSCRMCPNPALKVFI